MEMFGISLVTVAREGVKVTDSVDRSEMRISCVAISMTILDGGRKWESAGNEMRSW